ncbi:MAG: hypothetical protein U0324_07950 [Polyangiales bacterium]
MKIRFVTLAAFAAISLMGSSAFAQSRAGGQQAQAARTQEFNFTDELVQGQLVRPDGESTRVRRRAAGISLIRIREHFVPEMLKSVENL